MLRRSVAHLHDLSEINFELWNEFSTGDLAYCEFAAHLIAGDLTSTSPEHRRMLDSTIVGCFQQFPVQFKSPVAQEVAVTPSDAV